MFTPVLPERTALTFLHSTSEHQASGMIIGAACPTCSMGIVCHGYVVCPRCTDEIEREHAELDYSELMETVRGRA